MVTIYFIKQKIVYDISYKTFMGSKPLRISFEKNMDLLKFMMELDIYYYLVLKVMMQLTRGLDILSVKKVVLQILLIIIFQESESIHIIL